MLEFLDLIVSHIIISSTLLISIFYKNGSIHQSFYFESLTWPFLCYFYFEEHIFLFVKILCIQKPWCVFFIYTIF